VVCPEDRVVLGTNLGRPDFDICGLVEDFADKYANVPHEKYDEFK
jgi:hypothetical protein